MLINLTADENKLVSFLIRMRTVKVCSGK